MARIALVEDETTVSSTIVKILERAGHQVDAFISATSALAECDFAQLDLVITDLIMEDRDPGQSQGEALVAALQNAHPQLPVIVVTGAVIDRLDELPAASVRSVLRKPFDPPELIAAVDALV